MPFSLSRQFVTSLILQLGIMLFFLGIHMVPLQQFDSNPLHWAHGERLSSTADAYYFMRLAYDYRDNAYATNDALRGMPRLFPVPPLVAMTVGLHQLTGYSIERISFFLPTVLAMLLIPIVWAWARKLMPTSYWGPTLAALASSASFAFYRRVMVGRFDTDSLNLVLVWTLLLLVSLFVQQHHTKRWASCVALICTAIFLYYWWPQAGLAFVGLGGIVYAATFFLPAPRWEKWLKLTILVLGTVVVFLALTKATGWLPGKLPHVIDSLGSHLDLVFKKQQTEFFNMGQTIDELLKPTFSQAASSLSGSILILALSVLGLGYLLYQNRNYIIYLGIPVAFFVVMVFGGRRFLMFLVPAVALGLGYFWHTLLQYARSKNMALAAVTMLLALASLIPSIQNSTAYALTPSFDAHAHLLASTIDTSTTKETVLWNWWGPGYFLQHVGKRKTQIDGGSQSPANAYIAAVPLAASNVAIARHWIRFFSKYPSGLQKLGKFIGSKRRCVEFLFALFDNPQNLSNLVAEYGLPPRNWQSYFFPDTKVALVLFSDMLVRSTWLSIGRSLPGEEQKKAPIFVRPFSACSFHLDEGTFDHAGKRYPYSAVYQVTPTRLSNGPGKKEGCLAIAIPAVDKLFTMTPDQFDCLVFRLLFVNPNHTPGFKPLAYNPFVGGVWQVE